MRIKFQSAARLAILGAGAMSVAAFAAPSGDAAKAARNNDPGMASAPSAAPTSAVKTYCVIDSLTGSHVPRKVCKTKAEWSAEGIDVEHPTR